LHSGRVFTQLLGRKPPRRSGNQGREEGAKCRAHAGTEGAQQEGHEEANDKPDDTKNNGGNDRKTYATSA